MHALNFIFPNHSLKLIIIYYAIHVFNPQIMSLLMDIVVHPMAICTTANGVPAMAKLLIDLCSTHCLYGKMKVCVGTRRQEERMNINTERKTSIPFFCFLISNNRYGDERKEEYYIVLQ